MPKYNYRCEECGLFEVFRAYLDTILQVEVCPKCGKNSNRVYNNPTVVYKVGGFYNVDNKKGEKI